MPTKHVKKGEGANRPIIDRGTNGSDRPALQGADAGRSASIELDKSLLDQEVAYYFAHLEAWHEHEGEHVLIRGETHFGFFSTEDAALEEGFRRFGRVAFLVKKVRVEEEPRPLVWTIL